MDGGFDMVALLVSESESVSNALFLIGVSGRYFMLSQHVVECSLHLGITFQSYDILYNGTVAK